MVTRLHHGGTRHRRPVGRTDSSSRAACCAWPLAVSVCYVRGTVNARAIRVSTLYSELPGSGRRRSFGSKSAAARVNEKCRNCFDNGDRHSILIG